MYWDRLFCYDSLYSAVIYKGSRCSLRTYFSQCSYSPMCSVAHLLGGCLCAFNFYTFSLCWNPRVKTAVCYTKTPDLPLISLCRCHKHNRISRRWKVSRVGQITAGLMRGGNRYVDGERREYLRASGGQLEDHRSWELGESTWSRWTGATERDREPCICVAHPPPYLPEHVVGSS